MDSMFRKPSRLGSLVSLVWVPVKLAYLASPNVARNLNNARLHLHRMRHAIS